MRAGFRLMAMLWVFAGWAAGAFAQTVAPSALGGSGAPDVAGMMETLPEQVVKRLREAPRRFEDEAAVLIHGYGRDGAIDAAQIDRFIALQRASARGRVLRRFVDADLDNDGTVTGEEIAAKADTLGANERGRLRLAHQAADLDHDGAVSGAEMRALAQVEAMADLSEADAANLASLMLLDADGDGRLSLAEMRDAVERLAPHS